MNNIENRVMKVVMDCLGLDESLVSKDAQFVEDLGADSLALLELMLAFQAEFHCKIPDSDAREIATVAHAVEYLESRA